MVDPATVTIPRALLPYLLRLIEEQIDYDSTKARQYLTTDQKQVTWYSNRLRFHRRAREILLDKYLHT